MTRCWPIGGLLMVLTCALAVADPQATRYYVIDSPWLTTSRLASHQGAVKSGSFVVCDTGAVIPAAKVTTAKPTSQPCAQAAHGSPLSFLGFIASIVPAPIVAAAPPPAPIVLATLPPTQSSAMPFATPAATTTLEPTVAPSAPTPSFEPTVQPAPAAVVTTEPVAVSLVVSDQRMLLVGNVSVPLRTCAVAGRPPTSCLIAAPGAAGAALAPSSIELVAFNAWGDGTWTFNRLLYRLRATATLSPDRSSVTIVAGAHTARQPLRAIPGFGYAFPLVSTLGKLGATVWMNPDRVVVAD